METPKTHWKKILDSPYLGAHDLTGEHTITFEEIKKETVKTQDGEEVCIVAKIKGAKKPMILNRTNCKILAKKFDSPNIEDWVGKQAVIYSAKVKAFGEFVDAIRVKAK
jgi:hypothetical protein